MLKGKKDANIMIDSIIFDMQQLAMQMEFIEFLYVPQRCNRWDSVRPYRWERKTKRAEREERHEGREIRDRERERETARKKEWEREE
ncbi:hypothetical protein DVH24_028030 [Malus domestica]|uniref:Uncharacterized protein n=1 Tax=Malus domestica TaxID=3750 RepID=A0A498HFQ1_MALDO|nr:hypothetical protein DVH24_028030 [Malus domestica]